MNKEKVNLFFAADDRYLPYLAIALSSLSEKASDDYIYNVNILTTHFSNESLKEVRDIVKPNIFIKVFNIEEKISEYRELLTVRLRDYYSESIYYRMFIPSLFPDIKKAIYLDSDLILCDDVANLFSIDLGENLIGAVTDESVVCQPVFCDYVKRHIGITNENKYINSGVLLMNLDAMRNADIEGKFSHLLRKHNFNTVAPDQDYLNFLCKDKILYLAKGWNKHPIPHSDIPKEEIHIMHYNMFNKPWHYSNVPNEEFFWNTAKKTPFYIAMLLERESYTDEQRVCDQKGATKLLNSAKEIYEGGASIAETVNDEYFLSIGV